MLLKQPLIRIRPVRCGPAVLPALRPLGAGHPLGACRDLALDDAETALRLGLRGFHAREQETSVRGSIITPSPSTIRERRHPACSGSQERRRGSTTGWRRRWRPVDER
nr:hypothetical protein BDOA9_0200750 [Bradyrhizobium sp. DOA9]